MASKDHLEDVKREVLVVGELIEILSGEQKYLQRKLERHIKTVVRARCWLPLLLLGDGRRLRLLGVGCRLRLLDQCVLDSQTHTPPAVLCLSVSVSVAVPPPQKSNNARTFWYTGLEVLVLLLVTGVNLAVTTGMFKGGPSRITV